MGIATRATRNAQEAQVSGREERVEAAAHGGADESEGGKRRSTIATTFLRYLTYIK